MEAATDTLEAPESRGNQTRLVEEEIIAKASAGFQPLPMLDVIFSRMAPATAASFRARASLITEVRFDRTTYAPWGEIVTGMDPQGLPGALVADIMLSMGIGELRVMTRVSSMGVAVTDQPPAGAFQARELVEIINSAPVH